MLAVLLSAFKTDNMEKFEKEEKDERIAIVISNFKLAKKSLSSILSFCL